MAGENDQVEQELTPEENAAADAAFEAAFNQVRGDEPHAEGSTSPTPAPTAAPTESNQPGDDQAAAEAKAKAEAEAAAKAQADAEAAAKAQAEAERNAPAVITKAELDALRAAAASVTQLQDELKRTKDSTAGRFGSIQQTIEAIKAQAEKGQKPTNIQMKRLEEHFPELAAEMKADLEEVFGTGAATAPATDPGAAPNGQQGDGTQPTAAPTPAPTAAPDPFADPLVQQALREKEMAIVDAAHPGWRDMKTTPEFNEWRQQLPPAAQQLLGSSWDSKVLTDALADFKGWKQKKADTAEANKQRDKRLEHAAPATTGQPSGAHAVDEDAAFIGGFNAARGKP